MPSFFSCLEGEGNVERGRTNKKSKKGYGFVKHMYSFHIFSFEDCFSVEELQLFVASSLGAEVMRPGNLLVQPMQKLSAWIEAYSEL